MKYSDKNVFVNASSFPLCSDTDNLWKRNCFQWFECNVRNCLAELSSAMNADDSGFQGPPVSTKIGAK